jgi:hypothetical protein
MPESPDIDTIVMYIGEDDDPYVQGGIYKFDGTDWVFLGRTVNSLQSIFDIDANQKVIGDNVLEMIDGNSAVDLSDDDARSAFEDSSTVNEFDIDHNGIELSNTPVGGTKQIDFKLDRSSVTMSQALVEAFKTVLGIGDEVNELTTEQVNTLLAMLD